MPFPTIHARMYLSRERERERVQCSVRVVVTDVSGGKIDNCDLQSGASDSRRESFLNVSDRSAAVFELGMVFDRRQNVRQVTVAVRCRGNERQYVVTYTLTRIRGAPSEFGP